MEEKKYYYLKKGDEIKEGDEVEVSNNYNDPAKWQKTKCVGGLAPDPSFISHRKYRRLLTSEDKQLSIPLVSQQRELLIAFYWFLVNNTGFQDLYDPNELVNDFKAINSG